jgi:hypothetical protein
MLDAPVPFGTRTRKDPNVSEAVSIEQRLHDLLAGMRIGVDRQPERESPREMERRAMERLYGERSSTVVRAEHGSAEQGR